MQIQQPVNEATNGSFRICQIRFHQLLTRILSTHKMPSINLDKRWGLVDDEQSFITQTCGVRWA